MIFGIKFYWYKMIHISKVIQATLRHFKISFSLWDILFINFFLLLSMHILNHSLKKSQHSLYCLLLLIKNIVINITDFSTPYISEIYYYSFTK